MKLRLPSGLCLEFVEPCQRAECSGDVLPVLQARRSEEVFDGRSIFRFPPLRATYASDVRFFTPVLSLEINMSEEQTPQATTLKDRQWMVASLGGALLLVVVLVGRFWL